MKQVQCSACGNPVSSISVACPKCSVPANDSANGAAEAPRMTTTYLASKRMKQHYAVSAIILGIGLAWLIYIGVAAVQGDNGSSGSLVCATVLTFVGVLWGDILGGSHGERKCIVTADD